MYGPNLGARGMDYSSLGPSVREAVERRPRVSGAEAPAVAGEMSVAANGLVAVMSPADVEAAGRDAQRALDLVMNGL